VEFKKFIANWAVTTNTSHAACNKLLVGLRKFTDCDFPKDIRTLLRTPKQCSITLMGLGQYCHFGLRKAVAQMAHSFFGASHNIELL